MSTTSIIDLIGEAFTNASRVDKTYIDMMQDGNEIKYEVITVESKDMVHPDKNAINTSIIKGKLLMYILGFVNKCRYKGVCEFDDLYDAFHDSIQSIEEHVGFALPAYFTHIMLKSGGNSISNTIKDYVFDIIGKMEYNKEAGKPNTISHLLYGNNMAHVVIDVISKVITGGLHKWPTAGSNVYHVLVLKVCDEVKHQKLSSVMIDIIPACKSMYRNRFLIERNIPYFARSCGSNLKYINKIVEEVTVNYANFEKDYYIFKVLEELLELWESDSAFEYESLDLLIVSLILDNTHIPVYYADTYNELLNRDNSLISGIMAKGKLTSRVSVLRSLGELIFIGRTGIGKSYYNKIHSKLKDFYIRRKG